MNKPCVKCGSTDRKINGDCRPCATERDRLYKSTRRAQLAEKSREYYKENKEQCLKSSKAWRDKNHDYLIKKNAEYRASADKEKMAAHKRKHYEANTEKIKQRSSDWVKNNLEYVRTREKQYRKDNPEKFADVRARRRLILGFEKLPYGTIPAMYKKQNGLCACCGEPLVKYHVDHIMPLALGGRHIPENLQLLLPVCNQRKSKKHPDVWRAEIAARQNPQISEIISGS